jgi:hypothetical protein
MKKSNDEVAQCLGNFVAYFMSISLVRLKVMYFVSVIDISQLNIS